MSMGIEAVFGEAPVEGLEIEQPPAMEPEPAPAPEIETPPTPEPIAPVEDKMVPLAALLDTRDERNELKRRLAEYEAKEAALASKPEPQPEIDPYDDPRGFRADIRSEFQRELQAQRVQDRLDFSYQLASDKHGAEKVEGARLWALERAKTQPGFGTELDTQKHPMEWIVQQHAKTLDFADYETDRVAFARRILEQAGQPLGTVAAPAPAVAVEQPPAPVPPKSLASGPGKGGLVKEPTESALASVFGK